MMDWASPRRMSPALRSTVCAGMRERAELIGADFQVVSLPDQGTTVRVSLPL